jgi:hypothetical protein
MLRSGLADGLNKDAILENLLDPIYVDDWTNEYGGIVDFDNEGDNEENRLLDDMSTSLTYDEVHISVDEMSVLNDLHWRSIDSSQRVDIAWDLIAEGCARFLIQAGTMPTTWSDYLDNDLARKRAHAPHFVVGKRPSLIKLCLIILPPPDVPNIISGGVIPFGGYPNKESARRSLNNRQKEQQRSGTPPSGLQVDHEIVNAVSKIIELSWHNYEPDFSEGEVVEATDKKNSKDKKNKRNVKEEKIKHNQYKKQKKSNFLSASHSSLDMISDEGEGDGGVIGDAIEELLLRNIQVT